MRENAPATSEGTERHHNIEVWNDLVSPKDLLICLEVSVVFAAAAIPVSLAVGGDTLFWGLGASILGFIANCFLVPPKRHVRIIDEMRSDDAAENPEESGAA